MADGLGSDADFIVNELLVQTNDEVALRRVLVRWEGELVDSRPGTTGLAATHLLRINASKAQLPDFVGNLRKLDPAAAASTVYPAWRGCSCSR